MDIDEYLPDWITDRNFLVQIAHEIAKLLHIFNLSWQLHIDHCSVNMCVYMYVCACMYVYIMRISKKSHFSLWLPLNCINVLMCLKSTLSQEELSDVSFTFRPGIYFLQLHKCGGILWNKAPGTRSLSLLITLDKIRSEHFHALWMGKGTEKKFICRL